MADKQNPSAVRRAVKAEATLGEMFGDFARQQHNRSGKPVSLRTVEDLNRSGSGEGWFNADEDIVCAAPFAAMTLALGDLWAGG